MEILISVASKIAEYTLAPIGRQVGYLFFYDDNFKDLSDQVEKLKIAREDIKRLVEVEKKEGKEILDAVKNWLNKADQITDEVRQLCEDPRREKVGCTKYPFANLRRRHQLSRKAKKVAKIVTEVQGEGMFDRDKIGFVRTIERVGSTSTTSRFVNFESRMSKMNEIMLALANPKVNILGVYGFGGVGKSTLVKQIAGKAKLDNLFEEVVMTSVTRSPDLRRIQGEIADQLNLRFTEETVAGRAYRLRKRIIEVKNILIILDDIWATIELEDIGIPNDQKDCKVLLISRNQDVLQQMETQKDFGLEVLSERETLTLFEVMAENIAKDRSYEGIPSEVAKRCAGLPVLVVTTARALKNKDKHIWKDALSQLARVDNKELQEITYSALELSYNQLESDEVRAFFLLCGVEGPSVAVHDLLKYAIGLGIFKHIIMVEDARNRLYKIISALKASSLLHEDEIEIDMEFVKMHDNIHEVAISIAYRDEYAFVGKPKSELIEWPTKVFLRSCSKIILKRCNVQKLPERLDCPEVKFFHLSLADNHSLEIPDSFFEGMGKVKVLVTQEEAQNRARNASRHNPKAEHPESSRNNKNGSKRSKIFEEYSREIEKHS